MSQKERREAAPKEAFEVGARRLPRPLYRRGNEAGLDARNVYGKCTDCGNPHQGYAWGVVRIDPRSKMPAYSYSEIRTVDGAPLRPSRWERTYMFEGYEHFCATCTEKRVADHEEELRLQEMEARQHRVRQKWYERLFKETDGYDIE